MKRQNISETQIKYHYLVYVLAFILVSLQFLQVFEASVFQRDDLIQMIVFRKDNFYMHDLFLRPGKAIFWCTCVLLQNPILIRFFILSFIWIGSIAFMYFCNLLQINPLLSLFSINLSMSFWFYSQSFYHAASSWGTFCWAFSLLSVILFFISYRSYNLVIKVVLFVTSIASYWFSVTRNPQPMLFPLIVIPVILYFPDNKAKRREKLNDIKYVIRKSIRSMLYIVIYLLLTLFLFIIRWMVFNTRVHRYLNKPETHFDFSVSNVQAHISTFFNNIGQSFNFQTIQKNTLPPLVLFLSGFLTLVIYSIIFYNYRKKNKFLFSTLVNNYEQIIKDSKIEGKICLQVLTVPFIGFLLSFLTIFVVDHKANRYYFSVGIYFTLFILLTIHYIIKLFYLSVKRRQQLNKNLYRIYFGLIIFLILLSSYNRFIYIDNNYTRKAKYYTHFANLLHQNLKISQHPTNSQIIIIGHPAFRLTHNTSNNIANYRSSSGLLELISGRYDITGYIIKNHYIFNESIFNTLGNKLPLYLYLYKHNRLEKIHYFIDKEEKIFKLYELKNNYPVLLYSNKENQNVSIYMEKNEISSEKIWNFK